MVGGWSETPATGESRAVVASAALAAGFVALALARWALLPGLGFWDTGEFQTVGPLLGTAHPTGFPAYVILGWLASILLAPLGEPAFRMNLLSAGLVGAATAVTVILVQQLTGRVWIALATGLVMAAVPIVWNIGTHADVHALHIVLVAVLLVLLVGWEQRVAAIEHGPSGDVADRHRSADRWLLAAAIVYGIGLANHTLVLLLAPGIGLFVLATQPAILHRPGRIAALAGALLLAAGLFYLELPLRAGVLRAPLVYGHPDRLDGFLYVALAVQFVGGLSQPFSDFGGKVADLARFGFDQLGVLVALVPAAYVVTVQRRPRYALLTGVSFLITVWFASSYDNADIARYYLGPAVIALSWLALLGADALDLLVRVLGAQRSDGRAVRSGRTAAVSMVLEVLVAALVLAPTLGALPTRAQAADLSRDDAAARWAHQAMNLFEPNAVVISWWSYSTTLWYVQLIEGQRPDVWIVDDRTRLDENLGDINDVIDAQFGNRPVYVIPLEGTGDLEAVEARFDVVAYETPDQQPLVQVLSRKAP